MNGLQVKNLNVQIQIVNVLIRKIIMKKHYEEPIVGIETFEVEDVITESGVFGDNETDERV